MHSLEHNAYRLEWLWPAVGIALVSVVALAGTACTAAEDAGGTEAAGSSGTSSETPELESTSSTDEASTSCDAAGCGDPATSSDSVADESSGEGSESSTGAPNEPPDPCTFDLNMLYPLDRAGNTGLHFCAGTTIPCSITAYEGESGAQRPDEFFSFNMQAGPGLTHGPEAGVGSFADAYFVLTLDSNGDPIELLADDGDGMSYFYEDGRVVRFEEFGSDTNEACDVVPAGPETLVLQCVVEPDRTYTLGPDQRIRRVVRDHFGEVTADLDYDDGGRLIGVEEIFSSSGNPVTLTFEYDASGLLVAAEHVGSVAYGWDIEHTSDGALAFVHLSGGIYDISWSFDYDDQGRLQTVEDSTDRLVEFDYACRR